MDVLPHRGVFSWPAKAWTNTDQEEDVKLLSPEDLGVEIISHDVMKELSTMTEQATKEKREDDIAIFDLGTVVKRFNLWHECFPRIRPYFAIKANDDPTVICTLNRLGAGFDCSNMEEIKHVLKLAVHPSNVIYAHPIKSPSHLKYAASIDVNLMTVDNEDELLKIKSILPHARLVIRIAPCPGGKVEWSLESKFGCSRERATRLLQVAHQLSLDVVGVSFHVGSGCDDATRYIRNIEMARQVFNDAVKEGFDLKLLDIGGGFFGNTGAEATLRKMCGPIMETLENLFPESSGVKVISEPGRYFVESGLSLATCVIGKRTLDPGLCQESDKEKNMSDVQGPKLSELNISTGNQGDVVFEYYIRASVYGLFNVNLFVADFIHSPFPMMDLHVDSPKYVSRLWGPTCDTCDLVKRSCWLPEMNVGEWLVFIDIGAYSVTSATIFNGTVLPTVHRVIEKRVWDQLIASSMKHDTKSQHD